MNIKDELQTIAEHALCSDHGLPREAFDALNVLASQHCGLDLAEFATSAPGQNAVCLPNENLDAFKEAIEESRRSSLDSEEMLQCELRIGWMDGSEATCGAATGIKSPDDLVNEEGQFVSYRFEVPDALRKFAWDIGLSKAFGDNFIASDTFSILLIDGQRILPGELVSNSG